MTNPAGEPGAARLGSGDFYPWYVVAVLIATAVLSYTDRQVLSLLVDPIRRDLHLGDTQMSLLLGSAFAVVYGLAGLPLGYLADRVSRRDLIAAGLAIWSLATIACGLAHSFAQMFAGRLFVGLGEAALSPAAISLISDYFRPARRGVAVGAFLSGIAMGSGVAILLGGLVLQMVSLGWLAHTRLGGLASWRLVLILIGLPGLVWAVVIFTIREPRRLGADGVATPTDPSDPAPAVFAWRAAAPVYAIVAMASLVDNAVGAWAPSLLIREFSRNAGQVGVLLGLLLTLGFGGGVLAGGVIADRAATLRRKLLASLICAGLILPASLTMISPSFGVVLWGVPLYFALSGVVTALGFSSILQVVPRAARGFAMSISFFLNVAIGGGVGPTAVSLVAHGFGAAAGLGPPISAVVVAGYLGVNIAILLAMRAGKRA